MIIFEKEALHDGVNMPPPGFYAHLCIDTPILTTSASFEAVYMRAYADTKSNDAEGAVVVSLISVKTNADSAACIAPESMGASP